MDQRRVLRIEYGGQYPLWTIAVTVVLILVSPFVSVLLNYAALGICLYRVLRYDAKVFATDYVILAPMAKLFRTSGGLTLLIILCLLAALVYVVREGVKADRAFIVVLALLNYLLARMQMNFTAYLLCFGQMFMLWVLLPKQDGESAVRTAKMYCVGLLIVSVYALLLNGTGQIQRIIGVGSEAIWGTGIMRFHGLVGDPNFYMTELIVGVALLAKLRDSGSIKLLPFVLLSLAFVLFGALTYSKTFLLSLVIFVAVYIIWQFRNKKVIVGVLLVAALAASADFLLFSESSPFAIAIRRMLESQDLDSFTTGRSEIYQEYFDAIVQSAGSLFFGYGLRPSTLSMDPHNIYLEILYHCGLVGFILIVMFVISMISLMNQLTENSKQRIIARYVVLGMVLMVFMTLNGMFMVEVYPNFFLGLLAILIPAKKET